MNTSQIVLASVITVIIIMTCYIHIGLSNIKRCYGMWFTREYWTNYNVVEFISWIAKAAVIVPGLVFGINIWSLYFITLFTSIALIWASNKKALPTLVGFNTLWVWLSIMVLTREIINRL